MSIRTDMQLLFMACFVYTNLYGLDRRKKMKGKYAALEGGHARILADV